MKANWGGLLFLPCVQSCLLILQDEPVPIRGCTLQAYVGVTQGAGDALDTGHEITSHLRSEIRLLLQH